MATAVSISSNALLMLGDNPINSFSESASPGGLDRARIAENLWPSTRDSLLRSHPWDCAIKRVTLSPEATAPTFTHDYAQSFILPSDWLRNHEINAQRADEVDYVVEQKRLLMNSSVCYLRYIFKNTDVSSWDPMLVECAELAMAAKMAYPITKSMTVRKEMQDALMFYLRKARAVDGQDSSPATLGSFEILTARRTQ